MTCLWCERHLHVEIRKKDVEAAALELLMVPEALSKGSIIHSNPNELLLAKLGNPVESAWHVVGRWMNRFWQWQKCMTEALISQCLEPQTEESPVEQIVYGSVKLCGETESTALHIASSIDSSGWIGRFRPF